MIAEDPCLPGAGIQSKEERALVSASIDLAVRTCTKPEDAALNTRLIRAYLFHDIHAKCIILKNPAV
jgi:hypothetical protein